MEGSKATMKRLDRLICERGGDSRKQASLLVRKKRVTSNGILLLQGAQRYPENIPIEIDSEVLKVLPTVIAFHKPEGVLSANSDFEGRPCVGDWLPPRFHIVGRLDSDTRGLLLFSRDGALTQRMLHPKFGTEREYIATVKGNPKPELISQLAVGVSTSLGLAQARVLDLGEDWVRLVVTEGRNRIVRRMLHNAGHSVLELERVRFGTITIGDLAEGASRNVTTEELRMWQMK